MQVELSWADCSYITADNLKTSWRTSRTHQDDNNWSVFQMPHRALFRVWVWLQLWTSNLLPHSSGFSVPCSLCRIAAIFISSFLFVLHHTILWSSFCCGCCRYRILDSVLHVCRRIDQYDYIHSNGTHVEIAKNRSGAELMVSLGLRMHPIGAEHTYLNFPFCFESLTSWFMFTL